MPAKALVEWVSIAELCLCLTVLLLLWKRRAFRDFRMLATFVAVRTLSGAALVATAFFRKEFGMSKTFAYHLYFYSFWPSCVLQAILMVLMVYGIYSLALSPFEPLKKLGVIVFRWIAAVSVAVSLGVAIGPHMLSAPQMSVLVAQMQQTASVLTLCLLLFVCIALRPLGLTFGSRPFGTSLGLGIIASTQLFQSSWLSTSGASSVYSIIYFYSGIGACAALLVWGAYFAFPEAERRMVLLPTTSPYFFWNKISEALGDAPGFVAISGFTPDSMAPGELAAMMEASQPPVIEARPKVLQPIAIAR